MRTVTTDSRKGGFQRTFTSITTTNRTSDTTVWFMRPAIFGPPVTAEKTSEKATEVANLPWIRLQTTMFEHPKVLNLKEDRQWRAIVSHLEAMTYIGRHALAGYIPSTAVRLLHITSADVKTLVREGLWEPAPGGWQINGWDEYQLADAESLARSEKAKKAAGARWDRRNRKDGDAQAI
jgi:hypothetical protein